MSTQSSDIPTIEIKDNDMKDLLKYLYQNESLLKENGAIKLIPTSNFKNLLKKTPINIPLCSTIQQVKQIDKENLVYSIKTNKINENKEIPKENILINDEMFWLLLPNGSNTQNISSISIINSQTLFLKRVQRDQFDFHQLPFKSLLKLSGKKFCNQYSSTLIKAHGSATIFPLSSNKQNLYQLNYHHEGGIRYWYIIPSEERKKFEILFQENNPSICIEHNEIIIDPLLFQKYEIKYKRVIQNSGEILILSAGILSQGFTQDKTICEAIHFALPNYFYDQLNKNSSLCHCMLSSNFNNDESIDFNLYNDENIQGYIQKYLQPNTHQNEDSQLDKDTSFLTNINEEDFLMDICDGSTKFPQIHTETDFNELFSSEDFPNDIFMNTNESVSLTSEQVLNILDIPSSSFNDQSINKQIGSKNNKFSRITNDNEFIIKRNNNQCEIDVKKILHLSNLKKQITKTDLQFYFIGSTKIILKQSRLPPYSNYAFIFHRTNPQAEYNRKRAISSLRFGSNCQIEFVKNLEELSNENKVNENWNIVIKQIPENVTENDLKNLFFNSNQIKYIPARIVQTSNTNQKTLYGYAFLSFTNTEQADQVMNNACQYQINNQPLILSYYRNIEK
ncbi:unnamed protein product [Adineta steineri]|uniref:RRM domain-containing protein n=1 Tax=Adineta steineri TaxID=433720 RepID=A0A815WU75_9BILA|nr:unnamed protein product [Adineta steineri]CAF1422161.1 unnamed protein product [Adineta steineri]CAF1547577.1 unnamed protein product [Adineta steineri]CAF1659874.1 unnamed protein product [Adineta steineri]